jgi:hypothetical protein
METTHLGLAMPKVLKQLKEMLVRRGFIVQSMPTPNPVLIAYQNGNWLRRPRQIVLELSSIENNLTRIDITAILNNRNDNANDEHIIEGNFVSALYNTFKKVIQMPYGT